MATTARPDVPAAITAALAEGRASDAVHLVEQHALALQAGTIDVGIDRLEQWLTNLRAFQAGNPWLTFLHAWVRSSLREQTAAMLALRRCGELLQEIPATTAQREALTVVRLGQAVVAERSGDLTGAASAFAAIRADRDGATSGADGGSRWHPLVDPQEADRWLAADPSSTARFWLEEAALHADGREPIPLARALHNLAMECLRRGEPGPAERLANAACELKRCAGSMTSYVNSLNTRGIAAAMLGTLAAASDDLTESAALAEHCGHRLLRAYATNNLAEVAVLQGRYERARSLFAEAARQKERLGDGFGLAWTWRSWSQLERLAGHPAHAVKLAERALRLRTPCLDPTERAQLKIAYGAALVALGDATAARPYLAHGRALAEAVDAKLWVTTAILHDANRTPQDLEAAVSMIQRYELMALEVEWSAAASIANTGREWLAGFPGRPVAEVPPLELCLLGEFTVQGPGGSVEIQRWRSKRAAALLRLLASRAGRWSHRDEIIDALWPDSRGDSRSLLNAAVNTIRRELGRSSGSPAPLERSGERYRLVGVHTDAEEFTTLVGEADAARAGGRTVLAEALYEQALRLWRGAEPLPEDRYADWAAEPRARLMESAFRAREQAGKLALASGAARRALDHAHAVLAADPYRESAAQLLVRAHLALGERCAAEHAGRTFRHRMRVELGVELDVGLGVGPGSGPGVVATTVDATAGPGTDGQPPTGTRTIRNRG